MTILKSNADENCLNFKIHGWDCNDTFNCCSCDNNGCGCSGCYCCNACENCIDEDESDVINYQEI